MSSISPEGVSKILGMLLSGYSTREIGEALQVSSTSVSNVKKFFVKRAKVSGLMNVARSHGVDKQVEDLIELGKSVKGLKGGFSSVERGVAYGESFEKIDVDPRDVSRWIDGVYDTAMDEGLKPKEVGPLLRRLSEAGGESRLGFRETVESMEESARKRNEDDQRVRELKAVISSLEETRIKTQEATNEVILEHDLTRKQLDEYSAALAKCNSAKVNFDDVVALGNVVERMNGEKKPYIEVVSFYERDINLGSEREEKVKKIDALERSIQELKSKVDETTRKLDSDNATLNVIEAWKQAGLSPERGTALMGKVEEHAARKELTRVDALGRFFIDLEEHWEPLLGFANEYNRLSARVETSKLELDNLKDALRVTRQAYDSTMAAVKAKEALNERGVGDDEIVAWDKVLTECGADVVSFRGEMHKLGGVKALTESKSSEVKKAELKLSALNSKIYIQEETYNGFRAANEAFTENFENVVQPYLSRINEGMADLEAKLLNEESGIEPIMRSIVKDATDNFKSTVKGKIGEVSTEMGTLIEKAKSGQTSFETGVNSSIQRVDQSIAGWKRERDKSLGDVYELGVEVQKYRNLSTMMKVMKGEETRPFDFAVSFIALLDASGDYFMKMKLPKIGYDVRQLKDNMVSEMSDGRLSP